MEASSPAPRALGGVPALTRDKEQERMPPMAQHPSAQLCADYRVGDITPGVALAVAVHLAACPSCCLVVQEPAREGDDLWTPSPAAGSDAALPAPLRDVPRGRWRRIGRGVSVSQLEGVAGLAQSAQLMRAAPGARFTLPAELDILVALGGSISGDWGELSAGDLVELGRSGVVRADSEAGFLGLAAGSDTVYQSFFSRLFSRS